jgi:hypothetical protein
MKCRELLLVGLRSKTSLDCGTLSLEVQFDRNQAGRLAADHPRFDLYQLILARSAKLKLAAYAEVDRNKDLITRLLVPWTGRVTAVFLNDRAGASFDLDNSQRRFTIPRDHPEYRDAATTVIEALWDSAFVAVTQDEAGTELVDVRSVANEQRELAKQCHPLPMAVQAIPWNVLTSMFAKVLAADCGVTPPFGNGCIPFQYPFIGCEARAHQMCRILIGEHMQPGKVWNLPSDPASTFRVQTANSPCCYVDWRGHVAATLFAVPKDGGPPQRFVIDPSLFPDGPASPTQWQERQGDRRTSLTFSSPDPYLPPRGVFCTPDSNYTQTTNELGNCRNLLAQEIDYQKAPPPYPCPVKAGFFTVKA